MSNANFTPKHLFLILGLLLLISYPDIVLGSHAFCYRDAGLFGYPFAYYIRDCFRGGELPLWNPYNNCGIPFLAQWNTLVLYPLSLFYVLLPLPWSMNFFLVGHLFIAALGMYYLARNWFGSSFAAGVAGLAFAWNGFTLHALMWPSVMASLAWMPWVVLATERAWKQGGRSLVGASLLGGLQMMTGTPEIIVLTWMIVAGVCMVSGKEWRDWRHWRRLLVVGLWVAALAAAQLLPFFDLLAHGNRDKTFATDCWSMPPWGWANFLVPLFRCTPSVVGVYSQDEQQWTSSYYLGIAVLALGMIGAARVRTYKVRLLAGLALVGLFCALGETGYVFKILRQVLPVLGIFRYPVKFVVLSLFALPLLAAAAWTWLQAVEYSRARADITKVWAVLSAGILGILGIGYYFPFAGDRWNSLWPNAAARLAFLAIAAALIGYQLRYATAKSSVGMAVLLLFGLDVCTHAPRQNPTAPTQAYAPFPPSMSHIPSLGQSRAFIDARIREYVDHLSHPEPLNNYLGRRATLSGNCNLLEHIPKVDGFYPVYLREEAEFQQCIGQAPPKPHLADFVGAAQTASDSALFAWQARTNYMPFATIGQRPVFAETGTVLSELASPGFDPRKRVILPIEAKPQVTADAAEDACLLASKISAHECQFETQASTSALLTVAQCFYHPWRAFVDGQAVRLFRANHAFQAVEVPAGRHQVRLVYRDDIFFIGVGISTAALLASLLAPLWLKGRCKRLRELTNTSEGVPKLC